MRYYKKQGKKIRQKKKEQKKEWRKKRLNKESFARRKRKKGRRGNGKARVSEHMCTRVITVYNVHFHNF